MQMLQEEHCAIRNACWNDGLAEGFLMRDARGSAVRDETVVDVILKEVQDSGLHLEDNHERIRPFFGA